MSPKYFICSVLFLVNSLCAVNADDSKIISTYADSWGANPSVGWRHLTNEKEAIGKALNYVPLTYSAAAKAYVNTSEDINSGVRDSIVPPFLKGQVQQYAISAYTFQEDYDNVWLTNGNLQSRRGIGVELKIYLNDTLKYHSTVKLNRSPLLFQCSFEKVKKGDSVFIAVSSDSDNKNVYRLYYTLETFMPGKAPKAPAPIISPDITVAVPQLGPNGRAGDSYMKKHNEQCEASLSIKPELVFVGDSITARWSQEMFAQYFNKYKCANFGIGGDNIQNVLWRLENGVMDKIKPKAIVLLIGTNNVTHDFSVEEVAAGTQALVKLLNQKTPDSKILIMGIFPRGESIHSNPRYEVIKKINDKLAGMADNKKMFYMDIGSKLVEPDGSITTEMMKDHLHIGTKGYEIWGNSIAPVIDTMLKNN